MVEKTSFASSESLQSNESYSSFPCVYALVLAVLCAADFGGWEPQISKINEEIRVDPGL